MVFGGDEPRALPWAGMNDAFGVQTRKGVGKFRRCFLFSLHLYLHPFPRAIGRLERKERIINAAGRLVHFRLQLVQIFVQTVSDDFIHAGVREVRTELAKQLFGRVTEGSEWRA